MDAQAIAAVLAAIGAGAILRDGVQALIKHWTGRSARERARNTGILRDREEALRERDEADAERRAALEKVARYRRRLIEEKGIDPDTLQPLD
jgi:hypothetical protein